MYFVEQIKFNFMKAHYYLFLFVLISVMVSCSKVESGGSISGSQSQMGTVGTTFSSSGVTGLSNCQASVTSLSGNVSSISGSATVTNAKYLQLLQTNPGTFTINGSTVSITGVQVKNLSDGVEKVSGTKNQGVIVNYSSALGATYPIGNSGKVRTVSLVNTTDSYQWNGMLIKTIEVTEPVNQYGVKNIVYVANHKWGIVAIVVTFDDNSTLKIPVTSSKSN